MMENGDSGEPNRHTEDEAKASWCHARYRHEIADSNLTQCCIASRCMAWRWDGVRTVSREYRNFPAGWTGGRDVKVGFCGLVERQP